MTDDDRDALLLDMADRLLRLEQAGAAASAPAVRLAAEEELFALGVLSVDEAVQQSRLSRSELYGAIRSGELPSALVGTRRLIPRLGLIRFLASRRAAVKA